ncbi:hypothetical protein [Flavobacterium sp. CF136]|nr:hypothetical protein [Flavobacterium sp. CF136]EJL64073.1 hypothetical protein PMI10_02072 [Flavobacterium sp. CF136]
MLKFTTEQDEIFYFVKNDTGHGIIDAVAGAGKNNYYHGMCKIY